MNFLLDWLPKSMLFQTALRRLHGSPSIISSYWRRHAWVIALWLCTISLSAIGLSAVLFWVYGAND
jgi:hypothetical protein